MTTSAVPRNEKPPMSYHENPYCQCDHCRWWRIENGVEGNIEPNPYDVARDRLYGRTEDDLHPHAWHCHGTRFVHRPWFKVLVNTVLRLAQPRRARKWVLCSVVEHVGPRPRCQGYEFARVKYEVPTC